MAKTTSSADTRTRIVTAATELFRRQGFNGTSLSQIVAASEATTGSVYHFFPGGKDELTAAVLKEAGDAYGDLVELIIREGIDPARGMRSAFEGAAMMLTESDFVDPCPIGTIAREVASTHEPLRTAALGVMERWVEQLGSIFVDAGVASARAASLATLCVASIEGGFILARTHRNTAPWFTVGEMLEESIARELPS